MSEIDEASRPWHSAAAAHPDPVAAVEEFVAFFGFEAGTTLGDFQSGDSRSGEIEIRPPMLGSPFDPARPTPDQADYLASDQDTYGSGWSSTTAFVRLGIDDQWVVVGAASESLVVDLPLDGAVVSSPILVAFTNEITTNRLEVQVWAAGAAAPLAAKNVTAVSTFGLDLDPDAPIQTSTAFLEPVGDRRDDIEYQTGVRLSVFEPGECTGEPRPAVVSGRGIGSALRDGLTSRGYVVVEVDWRAPGNTSSLDDSTVRALGFAVFDLSVALQWLRAQADELCLDEHRMAVSGYSFGAIAALVVTYYDDDLATEDTVTIPELGGSGQVSPPRIEPPTKLAGISDDPDAAISFAGFALADTIEAGEAPVLMIHGRDDAMVPFALAEQTCASAAAVGVTCEILAHDDGHGIPSDTATLDRIDEFLRRELAIGATG
jgi:dienelactone hydrolase